ncbi:UDP-4-amino-4,6-dideoxy-N-acetyl-beta-L-altrosamine transaminase [uncultured Cohaesibacter sp.]|uniref:UDP-4-amino-4, 6-dideoxy-N-acetyl-beta-L-altrosamine transaminase n=1 Tax=uncultured Cohaesibacter sp. TaxID=1002546 RepID=UPI00292F4E6A|nr:UDP-4-amino-4,6-dideoxy-N-acetyl-beta-L-altrosamine transaminase [uncultured Cohaesibacter sp.]
MIPYGKQDITQDDIDAVVEVLKSDFLTQGPKVPAFEEDLKARCEAPYAVAVNSATSALHLACLALGVSSGDRVWTSPITFVASANSALYCGAAIDFVDIDPDTFNMCPDALHQKLIEADKAGQLPKVIIPVHMCGQSPDMEKIYSLAQQYGIGLIEDASHAMGARYKDAPVGNCQFSDITVFSFHPVKIVTTAEGGVALTKRKDLYDSMALLRSHGITRDVDRMTEPSHGPWYYQQIDLGYNYRMTDIQAALGLSQLSRLETYVSVRNQLASGYDEKLAGLPVILPGRQSLSYSAFHLYIIQLEKPEIHRSVFEYLRANDVGVNLHYIPVHLQPYYRAMGFGDGDFPKAEAYYARAISLPLHPKLTIEQQDYVVSTLKDALVNAVG